MQTMKIPRLGGCSGCGVSNSEENIELAKSIVQSHYAVYGQKYSIIERDGKLSLRSEYELQASLILFPGTKVIEYDFR